MINLKLTYKVLGSLLFLEAMFMIWCLVMALSYGEDDVLSFLISSIVTIVIAIWLRYLGRDAENTMSRRDAYLIVTTSWLVFTILGAIPYLIGGYLTNVTDAFFESMSGFTTTGATIRDDVELLPHGMMFWRSLTQWIVFHDSHSSFVCGW